MITRVLRAVLAGCALLTSLIGCSSDGPTTFSVDRAHLDHEVAIGRGQLGASSWELMASVSAQGYLCMGITWRPALQGEYGCGFGLERKGEWHDSEKVATATSVHGRSLAYGPAPGGAVRAFLTQPDISGCRPGTSPVIVRITHRVPSWYRNPGTTWYAIEVSKQAADCGVFDVSFADRDGVEIPYPQHF